MTSSRWPGAHSASLQLHAEPEEILEFIDECATAIELFVVFIWGGREPRILAVKTPKERTDAVREHGVPRYARLTLQPPSLNVRTDAEFVQQNPGCFLIDIGAEKPGGLEESSVGFRTKDQAAAKIWRGLANRLRRRTSAGAVAVNPETGDRGLVRTHRYTERAAKKAQAGVRLWALGGKSFYVPGSDDPRG